MTSLAIEPFWNRIPAIATYPFRAGARDSLLLYGILLILCGWLPPLAIVVWVAVCRYAFEVLLATAHGRFEPPQVFTSSNGGHALRFIVLQGLWILIPVGLAIWIEPELGMAMAIALLLVQPAAIIALALNGTLQAALSPEVWLSIIGRVGWPYLALIGLAFVIQFSAVQADDLLRESLPLIAANCLMVLVALWAMFATFHLMGYMVFQFHDELAFRPDALDYAAIDARHRGTSSDHQEVERLIQSGQLAGAIDALRSRIGNGAATDDATQLLGRLLRQTNRLDELRAHQRQRLHQLLASGDHRKALVHARQCLAQDPAFSAQDPNDNAVLAERARFSGQEELSIALLGAAIRDSRVHPNKPAWAMTASDLISRRGGDPEQARELLKLAIQQCADSDWHVRLQAQLNAIGYG